MEMIYCDFNSNQNGIRPTVFYFTRLTGRLIIFLIDRQTKMDRIQRRQIGARPFLRPAQFSVFDT